MYVIDSIYLLDIYSKTAKEARLLMRKSAIFSRWFLLEESRSSFEYLTRWCNEQLWRYLTITIRNTLYFWRTTEWCSAALIELSPRFAAVLNEFRLCKKSLTQQNSSRAGALWELRWWHRHSMLLCWQPSSPGPSSDTHLPGVTSPTVYHLFSLSQSWISPAHLKQQTGHSRPPPVFYSVTTEFIACRFQFRSNSDCDETVSSSVIGSWRCRSDCSGVLTPSLLNVLPHLL